MSICGTYKIINKSNGKYYVGSAVDIFRRWKAHKTALKNNKHSNPHLQLSYNKYGANMFDFIILKTCPKQDLLAEEQILLEIAKSTPALTYNMNFIAGCGIGAKKGCKLSESHKHNLSISHIGQRAWNKGKTKETNVSLQRMSNTKRGRSNHKISKSYTFINPLGMVVGIHNLKKYCETNDLNYSTMNLLYHRKRGYKSHRGWKAAYV